MVSLAEPPLLDVPLTIIAGILSQLDSIKSLGQAVFTHRVFHNTLRENQQTIIRSIISNQIPHDILPYAIAVVKSTDSYRLQFSFSADEEDIDDILQQLHTHLLDRNALEEALRALSLPECAFLSASYSAVNVLRNAYAKEIIPLFTTQFEIPLNPTLSPVEAFRIDRALLRHTLMCNLFTRYDGAKLIQAESIFFTKFSPWVNEQLFCVYTFMEHKVSEGKSGVLRPSSAENG
jgi:hypothetical protein